MKTKTKRSFYTVNVMHFELWAVWNFFAILLVIFVNLNAFTVGTQLSFEYTFLSFMEIKFHKQTKIKCNEKSSEFQ